MKQFMKSPWNQFGVILSECLVHVKKIMIHIAWEANFMLIGMQFFISSNGISGGVRSCACLINIKFVYDAIRLREMYQTILFIDLVLGVTL